MLISIYSDEVLQSFAAEGNVFLKLGAISGNVDQAGNDLKDIAATLIIPVSRFQDFAKNIQIAASLYQVDGGVAPVKVENNISSDSLQLGNPLAIPD
mgnify:CR=1 FL=1|jgi:hypothetical protein